jgi:hypothetical protein
MTYLDTPIDATVSQYRPVDLSDEYTTYSRDQIKQMVYDLGALSKENETFRLDISSLRNTVSSFQRQNSYKDNLITNAKVIILEAFDNDDFDKDAFTAVAEALEIVLTKEYDVTINVTFSGTVSVPLGFDMDCDLENYIDFEARTNGYGKEEVECDLYSDGIDITVNN